MVNEAEPKVNMAMKMAVMMMMMMMMMMIVIVIVIVIVMIMMRMTRVMMGLVGLISIQTMAPKPRKGTQAMKVMM